MMTTPAALASALGSWSTYYGDHQAASVGIRFLHLAGLLVGGGTAVRTDWGLVSARRAVDARAAMLQQLARAHRAVVPSLVLVVFTGVAMATADLDTFLASRVFWFKMSLFATLLANGTMILVAERRVRASGAARWTPLAVVSAASLTLWFVLLLVGTWLTVAA
jgi:hypothetical protein